MKERTGKYRVWVVTLTGVLAAAGVSVTGYLYHSHVEATLRQEQQARNQKSTELVNLALTSFKHFEWSKGITLLNQSLQVERTSTGVAMKSVVHEVQNHYLGLTGVLTTSLPSSILKRLPHGAYGVWVYTVTRGGPAAKVGLVKGDVIENASNNPSQLNSINAGLGSVYDLNSWVDRTPIGKKLYLSVVRPDGTKRTLAAVVGTPTNGLLWITGTYRQSRFGDSVTLPKLNDHGVPYGWEPLSEAATDGSGREFRSPFDANVSVTVYGGNNLGLPLSSSVPSSATILNNQLTIMGDPGIEYKYVTMQNGVPCVQQGIVVGGPNFGSMNGVEVSVPESQVRQWQPIIDQVLNSFTPGDLQVH